MPLTPLPPAFAGTALEFDAVRELLARHASFSAGREACLNLEPTAELDLAQRWQDQTAEMLRVRSLRPDLHLGGVHDVRPHVVRARVGSVLQPAELLDVASTVRASRAWRRGLLPLSDELPTLSELAQVFLGDHSSLAEDIEQAITQGGEIHDNASPALARIRGELRGAHDRLTARLRELMASPAYRDAVQDPVVTQRANRYVIPIRADFRGQVPGIVHDQSASGATLFVEPIAVVEMGNRWRELILEEEREIERILRALSGAVGQEAAPLDRSVEGLAQIDLSRACAALAETQRATPPTLVPVPREHGNPVLVLKRARHPLLAGKVVPVSLELGDTFDVLLISGPNTGGKTVALKTAGLLTLMAQSGLFIPADAGSVVAVFRCVQADIGDEQSLQQNLSTFSSHVTRIVAMLDGADASNLLLLDELGAGTDPQEGAALARALLGFLQRRGSYVVATSHYPELKAYAHITPRVQNASVEFDVETLSPTYHLSIGTTGSSKAFAIAHRLGMPAEVLEEARNGLQPRTAELDAMLAQVTQELAANQRLRQQIQQEAVAAKRMRLEARTANREAQRLRQEAWDRAQEEATAALAGLRREAERVRRELQVRGPQSDVIAAVEAARALQPLRRPPGTSREIPEGADANLPPQVHPGAEIMVPRLGMLGTIVSVRDGSAELEVMGRRVRLPIGELAGASRPTAAERREARAEVAPAPMVSIAAPSLAPPFQVDLRGMRRDEAVERLEEFLIEASTAGMPQVRIVHGKGTGAVRAAVRVVIRASQLVDRFEPEYDAAGGDGATLAWIV